jgi:hypothetical protein
MATTNSPVKLSTGDHWFHRRASSISPSQRPSHTHSLKRKRTQDVSTGLGDHLESVDADERPLPSPHKNSLLSIFSFGKTHPRGIRYEKMPCTETEADDCAEEDYVITPEDAYAFSSSPPSPGKGPNPRRSSRLGSFGSAIKSLFPGTRRRKDSSMCDTFLAEGDGMHPARRLMRHTASIEQLAFQGRLRFAEVKIDIDIDEEADEEEDEEDVDGPSDYWRAEEYVHRKCYDAANDPFRDGPANESFEWEELSPDMPTPITNAESGIKGDLNRWRTLRDWSPRPSPKRSKARQRHNIQLGNLFRRKNRNGKRVTISTPRLQSRTMSPHSRTVSPHSARFSGTYTPSLGSVSNLNLSHGLDSIGVLPTSDTASTKQSIYIPHAAYSVGAGSLLRPPGPSNNASLRALHAGSSYPASPALRPSIGPANPDMDFDLDLNLDVHIRSPAISPRRTPTNQSMNPIPTTYLQVPQDLTRAVYSPYASSTAVDDASDDENLQLRRASSLEARPRWWEIDNSAFLRFDAVRTDAFHCKGDCCEGRGRGLTRRF